MWSRFCTLPYVNVSVDACLALADYVKKLHKKLCNSNIVEHELVYL